MADPRCAVARLNFGRRAGSGSSEVWLGSGFEAGAGCKHAHMRVFFVSEAHTSVGGLDQGLQRSGWDQGLKRKQDANTCMRDFFFLPLL